MLREEQIDLRRQRARAANLAIENLGKNRVFSDYRVTNPQTKGEYTVTVRGFDTGDNACTCMDFIDREVERRDLERREKEILADIDPVRTLLKIPLYDFQARGAVFLACRARSILGDDMGLGKTAQTMAAVELLARERGVRRVLVVAPASVKYQWEGEIRKFVDRSVQVVEGLKDAREEQYTQEAFYKLVN